MAVTLGLVGIAGLLLLLVDHSSTIVRLLAGQLAGPTTTLRSAAPAAAGGGGRHPVLPPDWGGVQHYRIPGALMPLQPEVDVVPITGTLHVYLNAARWPDGHLRAKGFVAFLPWAAPASWAKIPRLDKRAMGNMVEVRAQHAASTTVLTPDAQRPGVRLRLRLRALHILRPCAAAACLSAGVPRVGAGVALSVAALGARLGVHTVP